MLNNTVYIDIRRRTPKLRHHLATLYPDKEDIRRVLADAGIDPTRISLNESAETMWFNALNEAEKCGQLHELIDIAHSEYGVLVDS
ncbi:MAG: effector-associated domain EAD1-containing protein [Chloroflexota bacterium]